MPRYTVYLEEDQMPDPQKFPNGGAWRSGIIGEDNEEIDGEGDLTREEAKEKLLSALSNLLN